MYITTLLSIFVCSTGLVFFAIPKIIKVATLKHLFDDPSEDRKVHSTKTPNLGGIAIFIAIVLNLCLFIPFGSMPYINFLLAASFILFTIGLKDDLVGLGPLVKFAAQILAALIITYLADIRLTSFYGLFGMHEVSKPLSILISVFAILLVVNAFNLIDGIDTLAGSIGLLVSGVMAVFFIQMHETSLTYLCITLAGALAGFLWHNKTPAKIFMGDTGSLLIGFIVSVLCIKFVELNKLDAITNPRPYFHSAPSLVCGMLIIPLFDTLRVFTLRILKGKSPFNADRNHIHHRLLDFNLTHIQSSLILVGINIGFIGLTYYFQNMGVVEMIIFVSLIALTINIISWHFANSFKEATQSSQSKMEENYVHDAEFKIVPLELKLKDLRSKYEVEKFANEYSSLDLMEEEVKKVELP